MTQTQQAEFDIFWRTYPRRVGKLAAQRQWERSHPALEAVLAALAWQTQQAQWQDVRFVPHPKTYLSQGRWLDEAPQAAPVRESWRDECRREHGGSCNSPDWHGVLMARKSAQEGA